MTDGSSQGLFVVVAVVIFGIFVAISYYLFRDTLRPSLASIFSDAIEQSQENISEKNLIKKDLLIPLNTDSIHGKATIFSRDRIEMSADGTRFTGVRIDSDKFIEPNKNYVLEFTVERTSGDISYIGGHLDFSSNTVFYLNGVKLDNSDYMDDDPFQTGIVVSEKVNHIRIEFDSNDMENDYYVKNPVIQYRNPIFIQPNRRYEYVDGVRTMVGFKKEYTAVISGMILEEF